MSALYENGSVKGDLMDLHKSIEMDKVFDGWSGKELKIAFQVINFLGIKGITVEEFEEYILFVMERSRVTDKLSTKAFFLRLKIKKEQALICAECGERMLLFPVNVSKCTQLPDKAINSTWMCLDREECGHQVYNKKPISWYEEKVTRQLKKRYGNLSIDDIINIKLDIKEIDQYSTKHRGCGRKK